MKRSTLRRTGGIAAVALTLSMSLAACGSDSTSDSSASDTAASTEPDTETSAPADDASEPATDDAGANVFGEGCALVPQNGKGSFNGMVTDPVATAASNNPLLGTLVKAVTAANLVDTLNGLPAATVFAPTDDAFKAVPADTLNGLLADPAKLTQVLTHHVLGENLDPTAVVGEQTTVNGDTVTVEGDTSGMSVTDGTATAQVLCGNIPTANATVYVIDTVLTGGTVK